MCARERAAGDKTTSWVLHSREGLLRRPNLNEWCSRWDREFLELFVDGRWRRAIIRVRALGDQDLDGNNRWLILLGQKSKSCLPRTGLEGLPVSIYTTPDRNGYGFSLASALCPRQGDGCLACEMPPCWLADMVFGSQML